MWEISRSIQSATKSACFFMISGLLASASLEPVPQAGIRRTGELQTSKVLPLAAERLAHDAKALEEAGAFAIVLELIPAPLASQITRSVAIPTIGIGAGPACDGQVLVVHDMLGLNDRFAAKFVKRYATLAEDVREAARLFAAEVREGRYPGPEHSFEK